MNQDAIKEINQHICKLLKYPKKFDYDVAVKEANIIDVAKSMQIIRECLREYENLLKQNETN